MWTADMYSNNIGVGSVIDERSRAKRLPFKQDGPAARIRDILLRE